MDPYGAGVALLTSQMKERPIPGMDPKFQLHESVRPAWTKWGADLRWALVSEFKFWISTSKSQGGAQGRCWNDS